LIKTSGVSTTFDEEHLFSLQNEPFGGMIARAMVSWYAFLMPEEDSIEGQQIRWQSRPYSQTPPVCIYNFSMDLPPP
jgi:hypothetical protein